MLDDLAICVSLGVSKINISVIKMLPNIFLEVHLERGCPHNHKIKLICIAHNYLLPINIIQDSFKLLSNNITLSH